MAVKRNGVELVDLELGLADGIDVFGLDGLVVDVRDELIEGFADEPVAADGALDDGARRFAGAETREAAPLGEALVGGIERLFEAICGRPQSASCTRLSGSRSRVTFTG